LGAMIKSSEETEDNPLEAVRDLRHIKFTKKDLLVGVSASGQAPYVLGGMRYARQLGARTAAITCNPAAPMKSLADVFIAPVVGPEVLSGSSRMKAGTAQKLVLNMLSTGAFIRLGYVYGNLMVNVQPRNTKLVDRARRIVSEAAGISYERAADLLPAAGNSVRTAILMAKTGVDRAEAERKLAAAGGRISKALHG